MKGAWLSVVVAGLTACPAPGHPYLTLVRVPAGSAVRLRLIAARGVRINARLKPTLETPEGDLVVFDSRALTADSAYFTSSPEAITDGVVRGVIRASVCPSGERLCRVVELRSDE
jgi:hypothetical protein